MTGSIIKLSSNGKWGSAFAVKEGDHTVFYTAAHVLRDLGFQPGQGSGIVLMCDDSPKFLNGPQPFNVQAVNWQDDCDLVTFDTPFAAVPFERAANRPQIGDLVKAQGYLFSRGARHQDMLEPDCGVISNLSGSIETIGQASRCILDRYHLALRTVERDLYGMSGGPVTVSQDGRSLVAAVLNGAPDDAGGPPFLATAI